MLNLSVDVLPAQFSVFLFLLYIIAKKTKIHTVPRLHPGKLPVSLYKRCQSLDLGHSGS